MTYETILIETPVPGVGLVRLNRPQALNALNSQITREVFTALEAFDHDETIGAMVLTGSDKAFAAGADIKQMADQTAVAMLSDDFTDWSRMSRVSKPIIGAVSGWALGGGCELAMMCDMIVASESAKFGQPEVSIGIIPGAGGTQRLTRAVGKAIAMEVMLGDRKLTAAEALAAGLVNRVYPVESYLQEAINLAAKIASLPRVAVRLIKDAVNKAEELGLSAGLDYEKRNFYLAFGTEDKTEGMTAFVEKRPPVWKHR
ncbi:MAG: enoyl-CoA hydratase/isomerase family protein [Chloroflexi bacterium]|uniref:enoyl-CoA hydratase-related protein n=1 Tax=Candidatus Flexifilum breve TaxID=3140694 RepID=UPI003136574F|nr:enoyl-CoA hydratase/isomerase family protein [Chloroflexota bacterium]